MPHIPVLLEEVVAQLAPQPSDIFLDGTLGFGGHASALLARGPIEGYIGLDQDPTAIQYCQEKFRDLPQVQIYQENFSSFSKLDLPFPKISKWLFDLGISSVQIDTAERGFSFLKDGPLDMRMNPAGGSPTAATLLGTLSKVELTEILTLYGELRQVDRFVDLVIAERKLGSISSTFDLVRFVKKGFFFRNSRQVYLATCQKVFQALRIAVNQELLVLNTLLNELKLHAPSGSRIAIITFHSLEDRIVKHFVKGNPDSFRRITKSPIRPTQNEIKANPRSRSAKLRVFEKIEA